LTLRVPVVVCTERPSAGFHLGRLTILNRLSSTRRYVVSCERGDALRILIETFRLWQDR
jgi:hypothetical protein